MRYLAEHWTFEPACIGVAVAVVVLHELGLANLRRRSVPARTRSRRHRSLLFYAGLVIGLVAVVSPIDYWSSDYFYLHMVQHILVAFFAPMLIVGGAPWLPLVHGLPVGVRRRWGRALLLGSGSSAVRAAGRFVTNPWTALLAFNAVMVLWHVPAVFDTAQVNPLIRIWVMDASLLVTGLLFWLQIIPSYPFRLKPSAVWQMGAILGTNFVMFVLAMAMSIFTDTSWYAVYAHVPGVTLSPFADQQLGAAILWVCGDFWAVPALVIVVRRALDQEGSLSDLADRLLHGPPSTVTGLEQLRRPG